MRGDVIKMSPQKMAQPKKNQHWVPQFYLGYFAIPGTQKIWAVPKDEGEAFITSIRNVAAQKFLYSPVTADGNRDDKVDERLRGVEELLARLWPRIAHDHYNMDEGFRKGISLFIATLFLRHPCMLESHHRVHKSFVDALKTAPIDDRGKHSIGSVEINGTPYLAGSSDWESYREATVEDLKATWGDMILGDAGYFARHLLSQPWSIVFSHEPVFVTSDHPVAIFHPDVLSPSLNAPGTITHFPISPTRLLIIGDNRFEDGKVYQLAVGKEAAFNLLLFRSARRYLFTPWDPVRTLQGVVSMGEDALAEQTALVDRAVKTVAQAIGKVGRNSPCPCGSGNKYKRCCGR
jgi:hypothetical protein